METLSSRKTLLLLSLLVPAFSLAAVQEPAVPVTAPPDALWWMTAPTTPLNEPMTDFGSDSFDVNASEGSSRWYPQAGTFWTETRVPGQASVTRSFADAPSYYQLSFDIGKKTETKQRYYKAHYARVANGWAFTRYEAASAVVAATNAVMIGTLKVNINIDMAGRKLQAGDREVLGFSFDGDHLVVDQSASVFKYDVSFNSPNCLNCPSEAKLVAGARK